MQAQSEPIKRNQHFLPCCYLQFFSLEPEGRKSKVYLFNGKICRKVTVESQGFDEFTYSKSDPNRAENFFDENFEKGYPPIARRIIAGKRLSDKDKKSLLTFAFVTRFRSPAYAITTGEERIDLLQFIMGSALNEIEPIVPSDWMTGNDENHMNRLMARYGLAVVKSRSRIWVSDNPVTIHQHENSFAAMVMMPISPQHTAVFYQKRLLSIKGFASKRDVAALFMTQREARIKNLYYPVDASQALRPGLKFPEPAKNLSEVTAKKTLHHHRYLHDNDGNPIFDFVTFR